MVDKFMLAEAFNLAEDVEEFTLDPTGLNDLDSFLDAAGTDPEDDFINVIDPEAQAEEDLQQSYIGKVITNCNVCHSDIFVDKDTIEIAEDGIVNPSETCPYCGSTGDGYVIVGEVQPYCENPEGCEDDVNLDDTETEIDIDTDHDGEEDIEIEVEGEDELEEGLKLDKVASLKRNERINGRKTAFGRSDKLKSSDEIRGPKYKELDESVTIFADGEKVCEVDDEAEARRTIDSFKKDDKKLGATVKYTYKSTDDINAKNRKDAKDRKDHAFDWADKIKKGKVTEGWRGSNDIEMGWNGEWADPDLFYKDNTFNYWDVEDAMWNNFLDYSNGKWCDADSNNPECETEFNRYVQDNGTYYLDDVIAGGYFEDGSHDWRDNFGEAYEPKKNGKLCKGKGCIKESIQDVSVGTEDETMTMTTKEDGGVIIETTPKDGMVGTELGGEMIAPLDDFDKEEIIDNATAEEEIPMEDDFVGDEFAEDEFDFDDFDEDSFDGLGESYLKRCYDNVNSFKTTSVGLNEGVLTVEGKIGFTSGNEKATKFVFEGFTKGNKQKLTGFNENISRGKKSFKLGCKNNNGKLVCESLNYNYKSKNDNNESIRVYGTVRKAK